MAGTKITRLTPDGYGGRRDGSFAGKASTAVFTRTLGAAFRLNLLGAAPAYDRGNEQAARNALFRADQENFKKGQDLHLARGEVVYIKQPNGTEVGLTIDDAGRWVTPSAPGGGGTGDVVGPAGATDNAIARFDGTTGKIIQNSGATVSDAGNITANNLSGTNTGDQTITLSGDASGSGTGAITVTVASSIKSIARIFALMGA